MPKANKNWRNLEFICPFDNQLRTPRLEIWGEDVRSATPSYVRRLDLVAKSCENCARCVGEQLVRSMLCDSGAALISDCLAFREYNAINR